MASQQSNITSTSTVTSTQEPMTPPRSTTSIGITTSNANPTVSTTAPVLSDAVQRCVDTAAEAIATHREARISFLQSLVRKMLRETYKEVPNPPSVGISTTQSGIDGACGVTTRGVYPSFVVHPNYNNGQIHHPPYPISQPPTTSATTNTTGMTTTQKSIHCSNLCCHYNNHNSITSKHNFITSNTQTTYCVCPYVFGGIPHQDKPSSCG